MDVLTPGDYDSMIDDAFAYQSRRLFARVVALYLSQEPPKKAA